MGALIKGRQAEPGCCGRVPWDPEQVVEGDVEGPLDVAYERLHQPAVGATVLAQSLDGPGQVTERHPRPAAVERVGVGDFRDSKLDAAL